MTSSVDFATEKGDFWLHAVGLHGLVRLPFARSQILIVTSTARVLQEEEENAELISIQFTPPLNGI